MTVTISPALSLDLRLRFIESLVSSSSSSAVSSASNERSLNQRIDSIQTSLNEAVAASNPAASAGTNVDVIRRFIQSYHLNEPLLRLQPITAPPSSDQLSAREKMTLILETEMEIRQLERELRQIEVLDAQGVVGAGDLAKHIQLKPMLKQVEIALSPVARSYSSLEHQTNDLLLQYNDYISTLSEIFIHWNAIVTAAEVEVKRIERERAIAADIS